jgi:hypothetical protein
MGEPRGGRRAKDGGRAASPCGHCSSSLSQGVVIELKREIVAGKGEREGEGGRTATILWPTSHAWPPLKPYFHPPLHLAPIMFTPLTKSTEKQSKFLSSFSKVFFIYFSIFLFYIMQW